MADNVRTRAQEHTQSATQQQGGSHPASGKCPHCGALLDAQYEFCPVCGKKLVDYCTFCGYSPLGPQDVDCPECGMPAEGVVCPTCHIRNFRSFCGQCGQPLSRAARMAVEKAKQDPKVQQTARLMVQIAQLEAELETAQEEGAVPEAPTENELKFRDLMSRVGFTPAEKPKVTERQLGRSREQIMAEYQQAVEDANRLMEEMLPPAGSTPQEQRNYYTARKVAVMEMVEESWHGVRIRETMGWECNYCHVLHDNPQQCACPQLGGRWVPCTLTQVVETGGEIFTRTVEKKVYKRPE